MISEYTYRFRLYPTKGQQSFLQEQFGYCRFVYNKLLETAKELYQKENRKWDFYEYKKMLPELKKTYPFLKNANSQSLQKAVRNLDRAFKNFFEDRADFPTFKKKKHTQSIHIPQHFSIEKITDKKAKLKIPKLKSLITVRTHRKIEGVIRSISITKTPNGKYYVNILTKRAVNHTSSPAKSVVGIDVGIKDYTVIHDGANTIHIENPRHLLKAEKRLIRLQRQFSRKQKGSKNKQKARLKVAKLQEKIANQRKDFLHKLSTAIAKQYDIVVVENLNVKGMLKNHYLAKAIQDAGWGSFINMLNYKTKWLGKILLKADMFFPSSKRCSNPKCGYINSNLTLSQRTWVCPKCGTKHQRDENASKNLYYYGLTYLTGGRAGTVRTQACGQALTSGLGRSLSSGSEAGTVGGTHNAVYETPSVEAGSSSIH